MDGAHEAMIESSLSLLFATYDEATKDGVGEPVLFLIDCEDSIGGEIARAWAGGDAVDDAVYLEQSERVEGNATTVFARALPLSDCRKEVPVVFPYLADVLAGAPVADGMFVIVVTDGGAAAFSVPLDLRS